MSDQTASGPEWVPDACTLPTTERPLRTAEFDTLFATASEVERSAATTLRLRLDGPSEAVVRDLAARESECCAFFDFAVTGLPGGGVGLTVTVPAAYAGVLDALQARAE